jgi:hypothetical protein
MDAVDVECKEAIDAVNAMYVWTPWMCGSAVDKTAGYGEADAEENR